MKIKVTGASVEDFVKRAFFLVYNACGGARGMGALQAARLGGRQPSEEQVWKCVVGSEDYAMSNNRPGDVYGDYVFGCMMKWGLKWDGDIIEARDQKFRPDYQSFCRVYPDQRSILEATAKSLGCTIEEVVPEAQAA